MNKSELVDALADRLGGNKKQAGEALEVVIDTIYRAVAKGEKVTVTGFGSFEKVERAARTGRNPATGETIKVKKSVAPRFRAGQEFKNVVSGKKKLGRLPKSTATATQAAARPAAAKKAATTAASPARKTATATKTATAPATRAATKKAPATKTAAKKTPATRTAATKTAAAKAPATKAAAKKAPAAKATASRTTKAAATKTAATKAPAKRAAKKS